jgi:MoaA/NifB/PqqE/SkfB family radical SAM enzyme
MKKDNMAEIKQRYGGLKILCHYEKLKSFVDKKITTPVYVRFKPTNNCNHHCSFCSYDPKTGDTGVRDKMKDRTDEIPQEKMIEIMSDFKDMGVKAVTFSGGGEPLIYPYIEEAMQKILDAGIDLSIITNGQCLEGKKAEILSHAHWVRISSDASDAESFSKIRKVPEEWFHKLTENIRKFAQIKNPKCELGINFVVHRDNADQVYRSVKHFKDLGCNHIKITPMWIQNFREYHEPINSQVLEQIERAKKDFQDDSFNVFDTYAGDFSGVSVSERNYNRCWIMQTVPVIGADCNVYFCHDKAYASSGILGSIIDKSFKELWFSQESAKIFETFNPQEQCRHHCANDSKNKIVDGIVKGNEEYGIIRAVLDCYGDDVNFI